MVYMTTTNRVKLFQNCSNNHTIRLTMHKAELNIVGAKTDF
jgi:hypothetical protein